MVVDRKKLREKNFEIIYLLAIKHSQDEHKKDKIAQREYRTSCMRENTDTYKTLVRKPESKGSFETEAEHDNGS